MAKAKADAPSKADVKREAMRALNSPNATGKELAAWIVKKYPQQKKNEKQLAADQITGLRKKMAVELGIPYVNSRGGNATAAKPASATVNVLDVVEVIEVSFDGDPQKLLTAVQICREWDVNQLEYAVATWNEMLEAAKGDAKLAKNMLEIVGRRV